MLDIENLCMIIASFHSSQHLTPELQTLILRKVHENLQTLNIDEIAKLFATISRYASLEEASGQESKQFSKLKQDVAKHLESKSS